MAEDVNDAGYLGEARYLPVGDVGHVCLAVEGKHVVFAEGIEVDILDDNHLVVVFVELSRVEHSHRVHRVSASKGEHGFCYPLGCFEQSFALGIFAQQLENAVVVLLEFFDGVGIECLHRWGGRSSLLSYIVQAPSFAPLW